MKFGSPVKELLASSGLKGPRGKDSSEMSASYKELLEGKHSYPQILFATEMGKEAKIFFE